MLKYSSSVTCLGILAISCASKNGVDNSGDAAAADSAGGAGSILFCANPLGCNAGGGAGGADGGVVGNLKWTGGIIPLTDALWTQITSDACAGWNHEIEPSPALLEFVVDDSGSMVDKANGTGTHSKWEVTRDALGIAINGDATAGTTGLPNTTAVGMLFFPDMMTPYLDPTTPKTVDQCVNIGAMVPVQPLGVAGSTQRTALARGLATAAPAGGTPTDDAYTYAFQYGLIPFTQTSAGYARFMVLITDGQPTMSFQCIGTGSTQNPVDPQPILDHVNAFWQSDYTKTFVIGSPGSEAIVNGLNGRTWLSQAATAGQTPVSPTCNETGNPSYCHFDMTQSTDFTQALTDALKAIIAAALPCSFPIPPPTNGQTINPDYLNVIYNESVNSATGTPTAQWVVERINPTDAACINGTADGWYVDASNNMVLCPKTCNKVQSDKTATLLIRGGCITIDPTR